MLRLRLAMTGSKGLAMTGSEGLAMTGSEGLAMTESKGLAMTGRVLRITRSEKGRSELRLRIIGSEGLATIRSCS